MNRAIKILLGSVAVAVVVVIVAVVLVAVFFDANAYRGQIIAKVEQHTGRSMTLGAIHLSVFPTLGLKLDDAALGNAPGFGNQAFVSIHQADVGVRVLPLLLEHKLEVSSVYLSGLHLDLQRNAQGVTNWAGLEKSRTQAGPRAAEHAESAPALRAVEIGTVNISDASIHYADAQKHEDYQLDDFSLSVGALGSQQSSAFRTQFKTTSAKPAVAANVKASGKLTFDVAAQRYAVQDLALEVQAAGADIPGGKQDVKLSGDVAYDGKAGTARLATGRLSVAGVSLHTNLDVQGLGNDKLRFTGALRIDSFSPRDALEAFGFTRYRPRDIDVLRTASLAAELSGTRDSLAASSLEMKLDKTTVTGSVALTPLKSPTVRFDLKADALDVDHYLPIESAAPAAVASRKAPASPSGATPIPVDLLDKFNADGVLAVGKLVVHGVKMADASLRVAAHEGAMKSVDLKARLYGGSVASHTGVTPGALPRYTEKLALKDVDIGPLIKDATGKDVVSGRGDVDANVTSSGTTVQAARRALAGHVSVALANGALKGFDLGRIARQVTALAEGGGDGSAALATPAQKTDFTAVKASGKITNGVLTSKDLTGASPLLRLAGEGTVNLVDDTIDYTLKPTLVNTATGQGGKNLSQLRGITIPVHISGPFAKISYRADLRKALKGRAQQEVDKQLEKHKEEIEKGREHLRKELNKGLQNGLKGLFGTH